MDTCGRETKTCLQWNAFGVIIVALRSRSLKVGFGVICQTKMARKGEKKLSADGVINGLAHFALIYLWKARLLLLPPLSTAHQRGAEDSLWK